VSKKRDSGNGTRDNHIAWTPPQASSDKGDGLFRTGSRNPTARIILTAAVIVIVVCAALMLERQHADIRNKASPDISIPDDDTQVIDSLRHLLVKDIERRGWVWAEPNLRRAQESWLKQRDSVGKAEEGVLSESDELAVADDFQLLGDIRSANAQFDSLVAADRSRDHKDLHILFGYVQQRYIAAIGTEMERRACGPARTLADRAFRLSSAVDWPLSLVHNRPDYALENNRILLLHALYGDSTFCMTEGDVFHELAQFILKPTPGLSDHLMSRLALSQNKASKAWFNYLTGVGLLRSKDFEQASMAFQRAIVTADRNTDLLDLASLCYVRALFWKFRAQLQQASVKPSRSEIDSWIDQLRSAGATNSKHLRNDVEEYVDRLSSQSLATLQLSGAEQ